MFKWRTRMQPFKANFIKQHKDMLCIFKCGHEDSQKNIDDVLLKVCNTEQLLSIKPSNFELIIYKVANIGGEYKLEKIAC